MKILQQINANSNNLAWNFTSLTFIFRQQLKNMTSGDVIFHDFFSKIET